KSNLIFKELAQMRLTCSVFIPMCGVQKWNEGSIFGKKSKIYEFSGVGDFEFNVYLVKYNIDNFIQDLSKKISI
ncbi:hypothetical protein, partial [Marinospirillum sp.]|uniref:hypothetical protein n=1 Tax=Marinospirillum sp. TaxID=2183934 RepID=UPI0025C4C627